MYFNVDGWRLVWTCCEVRLMGLHVTRAILLAHEISCDFVTNSQIDTVSMLAAQVEDRITFATAPPVEQIQLAVHIGHSKGKPTWLTG